jgi:16S rRNA (cytosine1402-N4)-methyltransferase
MPDESDERNPIAPSNSSNSKKTPETAGNGDAHTSAALSTVPNNGHEPVLLDAVLQNLAPNPGQTFIDCTLGRGGHSLEIARRLAPSGVILALDADPRNLEFARQRLKEAPCRIRFFHANFAELPEVIEAAESGPVDGILADLGLSTNQLFDPQYGLSFSQPMPLDMRIDPRTRQTAADLVNHLPEEELANVLYQLAQERYSRRIARKIVEARRISPINTTDRLAGLVRSAIPSRPITRRRRHEGTAEIDPATRTFLALRIKVNQELANLQSLLQEAPRFLKRGGRLAVISFQSTEDRQVKQAFRSAQQSGLLKVMTPKPLCPTDTEIAANPRSRSAKLRVAERV